MSCHTRKENDMKQLECPLTQKPCLEQRCGWFHVRMNDDKQTVYGACALVHIAGALRRPGKKG